MNTTDPASDPLRDALGSLAAAPPPDPDRLAAVADRSRARLRRRRAVAVSAAAAVVVAVSAVTVGAGARGVPGGAAEDDLLAAFGSHERARSSGSPRPAQSPPPPDQPLTLGLDTAPRRAAVGHPVKARLEVRDGDGRILSVSLDFGDGSEPVSRSQASPRCPSSSPDGSRAAAPTSRRLGRQHTYSQPGRYVVTAIVRTGGCGAETEEGRVQARVTVGDRRPGSRPSSRPSGSASAAPSADPSASATSQPTPPPGATDGRGNGPEAPRVAVRQVPPPDGADRSLTYVRVIAGDRDGYVTSLVVDWGDGSPPWIRDWDLSRCRTGDGGYPESLRRRTVSHRYAEGDYRVTVTAVSTACDGSGRQEATAMTTVSFPAAQPSPRPS